MRLSFLEEAEEDMEFDNLPPLENVKPIPVPNPIIPSFIPFTVSTGQCCIGLRAAKGRSEVSLGSVDRGGSCWW